MRIGAMVCGMLVALAACSGDDANKLPGGCDGSVATAMAGAAAGTVDITGDFAQGQPIIEVIGTDGSHMDYPATDYTNTTASFTGIPAGALSVKWILSCFNDEGQVTVTGPANVTVH